MSDSVKNLIKRIQRYNAKKRDEIRPASTIQYDGSNYTFDDKPITVTETGERQLFGIARMPVDFIINRMKPKERVSIFNRIFREEIGNCEYMFRFHADTLYGVVSNSYSVMDNIVLVDLVRDAVSSGLNLVPVQSLLEPDHTKIRLVSESDRVGDLMPMIEFTNSENGLGSLRLYAGIFRLLCSNGLMINVNATRARWIHVGSSEIESPDFHAVLGISKDFTRRLDATHGIYLTTAEKIRILEQVSANLGQKVAATFVRTANREYNGAPEMFSLINSLTAAAQQFPAIQSTQIETYASSLLN